MLLSAILLTVSETILEWARSYGYVGLFVLLVLGIVGLPIPDETLLTAYGFLCFQGELSLPFSLLAAYLGSLCGITLSYVLGRTLGYKLLHRYGPRFHLTEERVETVHRWFHRFGRWTLSFGYFIPGVRHLTAFVAGASKLEFPTFALFAYPGGAVWATAFICAGYLLGKSWDTLEGKLRPILLVVVGILAAAGIGYLIWRRVRRRSPRAPVAPAPIPPPDGGPGPDRR